MLPKISRDKTTKGIYFVVGCKIITFSFNVLMLYVNGTVHIKVKEYVEHINTYFEYISL